MTLPTTLIEEASKEADYILKMQRLKRDWPKFYWAKRYHKNTKGQPMTFLRAPFLLPIYKSLDRHRRIAIVKSVQCGISESLIIAHLEEASRGLSILYVLPKSDLRNTFVQNRINRVISSVPKYKAILKSVHKESKADSVHIKIFGKGVIKYVDANSQANFVEYPADALYLDEKDQMNQTIIEMGPDRLSASEYKLEREVANPSVEDFGIDARWKESSKGIWHVKCPHCNKWQHPDWFNHVVREIDEGKYELRDKEYTEGGSTDIQIFCIRCARPFDRFKNGQYLHKYKRKWIGYHINKIFGAKFQDLGELWDKFEKALTSADKMQIFFNSDLGLPYSSVSSKITSSELDRLRLADYFMPKSNDEGLVSAGVDVGNLFHIIIRKLDVIDNTEKKRLLYRGSVRDEDKMYEILERYGTKIAVIDKQPEPRTVERAQEKLRYMYSCDYRTVSYPTLDKKNRAVRVDRTTVMDELKENVAERKLANFADMKSSDEYYVHLQSNTRVYNAESNKFEWVQSNKPDHYAHSEVYCNLGLKIKVSSAVFKFYQDYDKEKKERDLKAGKVVESGKAKSEVISDIMKGFYGVDKA